ncbi:helix-turn-helix domain-containing protein [Pseudoclavibacter sp. VKM Ac-2888]|uniref:helix-turn-helix domain-containing protein n=1 Tax=Pseudoclavibacter sp. VKM Ac-2888 TaxID=2783830 RepID=UPI00188C9D5E|nr:helix-turn-helix domain-containing protein [Pseudoclavibacter sp. VKM Ac-2888]MBF4549208.1 helix-turn-helix domain-containing protein [Pseudoclavibacter sp. VKM Ac-2888]
MSLSARRWAQPLFMRPDPDTGQLVKMSTTEKAVLLLLAEYEHQEHGYAYPGLAKIARETCAGRSTVIEAISTLEACGYIRVERQRVGSRNLPNHYYLPHVSFELRETDERWMDAERRGMHGSHLRLAG